MAAFTTTKTGNWNDATVWNAGGAIPGNGDTVTIASSSHTLTVNVNTTVGHSPGAGDAVAALLCNGPLVLAAGVKLTVRGDLKYANVAITLQAGATLEFDASAAATPSTALYTAGPTASVQPNGGLVCNGTAGAHCTVQSNAGGANGRFSNNGFTTQLNDYVCTYTDFLRIGDATHDALQNYISNNLTTFSFTNCTFTNCGQVNNVANIPTTVSGWQMVDVKFTGTQSGNPLRVASPNALAAGTLVLRRVSFDKTPSFPGAKGILADTCYFHDRVGMSGSYTNSQLVDCFVRKDGAVTSGTIVPAATMTRVYALNDYPAGGNIHMWGPVMTNDDITFDGCVYEFNGPDGNGDFIDPAGSPTSIHTLTARNNLVLPTPSYPSAGWQASALFIGLLGNTNMRFVVEHNTFPSTNSTDGIYCGDSFNPPAGYFTSVKSNLAWDNQGGSRGIFFYNRHDTGAANTDVITTADYNCGWNMKVWTDANYGSALSAAGNTMYGTPLSTAPGAHDLPTTTNPQFKDTTRRLRTWGATQGADGTDAGALALLQATPTLIPTMMSWVKSGWAPTNSALANAAHDSASPTTVAGGTIGAVAYAAPAGLSRAVLAALVDTDY
jgi:hypothetical protein